MWEALQALQHHSAPNQRQVSGVELSGWKAPLAGAAFGLYSAQLPQGRSLGSP